MRTGMEAVALMAGLTLLCVGWVRLAPTTWAREAWRRQMVRHRNFELERRWSR